MYRRRKAIAGFFKNLFDGAKSGALFLYLDNNHSKFYHWFENLARAHNLEILDEGSGEMKMEKLEEKQDLGRFFKKFGNPKITADIAWRVARKP